ncbi:hypothetical protein DEU56DRAFT_103300 [Suillus clintonianus]|uniref:uncharacterized protein n=1 Tax=Suillus clintonianus TaxID=1904413 RepID=UPI001B86C012|nr:uncharacterized protein DEU56DRAFT_103300 [Suillus clintonianus]KAG2147983.1 hypothetical protein DEU56DRAFT_103300 [Suillus clintonianus]
MSSSTLPNLLAAFSIPQEFSRFDRLTDEQILDQLVRWKINVCASLTSLRDLLATRHGIQSLPVDEQADIAASVAVFDGPGEWIADDASSLALSILDPLTEPHIPPLVLTRILTHHLKPAFAANPHPRLNLQTGRKLHQPADTQDAYEGQVWKTRIGTGNVLGWCLRNIESSTYESVWHLILPPVMTFLDDFEASYKLRGVQLVSDLLSRVPPELLKRTGVDGLLFTSLSGTFNHLRDPLTPDLIRAAVPITLHLIDLTTPSSPAPLPPASGFPSSDRTIVKSGSSRANPATRYEHLSTLLGSCLIGTVFLYAYADPEAILAATDMLPPVLTHIGIGAARWLKALIPQLTHTLIPSVVPSPTPPPAIDLRLKVSSLRALCICIETCAPRMYLWKCNIIDAIGRAWAGAANIECEGHTQLVDETGASSLALEYKALLQSTCVKLAEACPSIIQEEYQQFITFDSALFSGLVGRSHSVISDK